MFLEPLIAQDEMAIFRQNLTSLNKRHSLCSPVVESRRTASTTCEERSSFLNLQAMNGSIDDVINKVSLSSSTVIAIGEVHETYLDQELAHFLKKLVKAEKQINCLVLEYRKETIELIEQYIRNPTGICLPNDILDRLEIFKTANQLGIKLIAGEVGKKNMNSFMDLSIGPEFLNPRDEALGNEIRNKTLSGDCKKSVVIYGSDHITDGSYIKSERHNLTENLRTLGLSVTTIQAVVTGSVSTSRGSAYLDRRWISTDCEATNPQPSKRDFGFQVESPFDITSKDRGTWTEVDYIIGFKHQKSYKPGKSKCTKN